MVHKFPKTYNGLVYASALRARELADEKIDMLRSGYPENTETRSELIRLCKEQGLTRGQMVEAILAEEFTVDDIYDTELPSDLLNK